MSEKIVLRWVAVAAALTVAAVPTSVWGQGKTVADREMRALEARVNALEKQVNAQAAAEASDSKTVGQRIEAIEAQVKAAEATIAEKLGVEFHALVALDYLYNFNKPAWRTNTGIPVDTDANNFMLNDAALFLLRQKEDSAWGFFVSMDFGKTAQTLGSVTYWSNSSPPPGGAESADSFDLRDAYLTYKIPVGDGITLKGGKFVTLLGYEVFKTWTNFNPNLTNSMLFGYAVPFTHTGLLASMPVGEYVTVDAALVNGWDNPVDNNSGISFLGGLGINPADFLSLYFAGIYGPEQTANPPGNSYNAPSSASKLGTVTGVVTARPLDTLTFVLEGDYGSQSRLLGPNNEDSADWWGFAGYTIWQATERIDLALRAEVFVDSQNTRGMSVNPAVTGGITAWEITAPTVTVRLLDSLLWRTEYRHDEANKEIYQYEKSFVNGQNIVATELLLAF